jgi:hypothetical protein
VYRKDIMREGHDKIGWWRGKKLADTKPEGEVGAYSRKVGSGDNVTEAGERKTCAEQCGGGMSRRKGGTDECEKTRRTAGQVIWREAGIEW